MSAPGPRPGRPLLVLDTGSPLVSVAVGAGVDGAEVLALRTLELRRSSELLLGAVEEVLAAAGTTLAELGGVAALQGPGSFTGLRIGLATVLGWHQALGLPATALPTLDVLAAAADAEEVDVVAAVDAIRGEWTAARYPHGGGPPEAARLLPAAELASFAPCRLVGFGVGALAAAWPSGVAVELVEPPPLAAAALALAARAAWDPRRLVEPIYARPPAVTSPA